MLACKGDEFLSRTLPVPVVQQAGHDVTVLEGQKYPGGSAGTFHKRGYYFDAGATVAGGLGRTTPQRVAGAAAIAAKPQAMSAL